VSTCPTHWILAATLVSASFTSSYAAGGLSFNTSSDGDERIESCSDVEMRFWRDGWGKDDIVTARRSQTLSLEKVPSPLRVEGTNRGGVRIQPSTDGKYSALICMAAGATSDKAAEAILDQLSVVNRGGVLRVEGPEDDDWAGIIVLSVPNGSALDVSATNGPVRVGDVEGRFTLRTQNGPIKVVHVGGVVDARAQNGPIKFTGHSGDVYLSAQNGPISVDIDAKEWTGKRLEASTQNGPLKLGVPDDMKSGVEVTSSRWAPWSGAWRSGGEPWGGSRTYRIGDDPVRVRLTTVNGPVKIRGPEPAAKKASGVEI
jgi:hypothetical protein